jgi:hypothetical protein
MMSPPPPPSPVASSSLQRKLEELYSRRLLVDHVIHCIEDYTRAVGATRRKRGHPVRHSSG